MPFDIAPTSSVSTKIVWLGWWGGGLTNVHLFYVTWPKDSQSLPSSTVGNEERSNLWRALPALSTARGGSPLPFGRLAFICLVPDRPLDQRRPFPRSRSYARYIPSVTKFSYNGFLINIFNLVHIIQSKPTLFYSSHWVLWNKYWFVYTKIFWGHEF